MLQLGLMAATVLATSAGRGHAAETPREVLPGHPRVRKVPAPRDFFGFEVGSRHLRHDQVVDYFRGLGKASPRVTIIPYANSHGGRPLLVAAITSASNSKRLDAIRASRPALTGGTRAESDPDQPLVMYMGYSIHGDEASAVNAAPIVAYHLASSKSEQVRRRLEAAVYLVDPALNPDGIDRFANWSNENRGRFPSDAAVDREHNQPWPGGRTNYYWFDLNRDWLPLVHPESRGRVGLFHRWKPNVVLDFHEMSGRSSYFFQPGVPERNNPLTPPRNFELTRRFAAEHARSMDAAGELYYTEERFDDFYAGKGSTYPDLHGAIGILFEQGSTRGLRLKSDRGERTFAETVANQVRTSLSSLAAADDLREELLEYQRRFYARGLREAESDELNAYVLTGEASRIESAAELLSRHDIEVSVPAKTIHLGGERWRSGTALVIPIAQPEATMLRSLMDPRQEFRENIFYDVSTWYLPAALDLTLHRHDGDLPPSWISGLGESRVGNSVSRSGPSFDRQEQAAGYLFSAVALKAPRVVARLHEIDADVRVTTEPIETRRGGVAERWPAGTFVVLRQPNRDRWARVLDALAGAAEDDGVVAEPLESGLTPGGPDLGSDSLIRIPVCKPLLVVGPGTRAYAAGSLLHHLDVRMAQPAVVVDTFDFLRAELDNYTCVILPDGSYGSWDDSQATRIRRYVESGGTVVATASAANWLDRRELISIPKARTDEGSGTGGVAGDDPAGDGDESLEATPPFGRARERAALESIAGAFFQTRVDPTHPLGFGFPNSSVPVFRHHARLYPVGENPYQTAARYTGVIAGYASQRNRERLRGSAAVWADSLGRGRFILIADNPVFRGYVRSAERFFSNAVLLGPTLRIPAAPVSPENPGGQ